MKPSLPAFNKFWEAARGHIRVMTIAPELDGALEVIAEAARRGVCVSLGHSDADLETARAGFAAGARHATHTFNAMRPLGHRDPGILAEIMLNQNLSADIIADGLHVDPAVVNLFMRLKGPELAVLITDGLAATGMPPGKFHMGDFEVEVKDGKCLANGILAGSTLTMDQAVRNVMQFAGWNLQDSLRAATANPARVTSLETRGVLEPGAAADLVALTSSGEVRNTIIGGKMTAVVLGAVDGR
jgi:N-acetylglucosamine-6-phosphate deacetylase